MICRFFSFLIILASIKLAPILNRNASHRIASLFFTLSPIACFIRQFGLLDGLGELPGAVLSRYFGPVSISSVGCCVKGTFLRSSRGCLDAFEYKMAEGLQTEMRRPPDVAWAAIRRTISFLSR